MGLLYSISIPDLRLYQEVLMSCLVYKGGKAGATLPLSFSNKENHDRKCWKKKKLLMYLTKSYWYQEFSWPLVEDRPLYCCNLCQRKVSSTNPTEGNVSQILHWEILKLKNRAKVLVAVGTMQNRNRFMLTRQFAIQMLKSNLIWM